MITLIKLPFLIPVLWYMYQHFDSTFTLETGLFMRNDADAAQEYKCIIKTSLFSYQQQT